MANWAFTDYAIEGDKETLIKIEEAIKHHPVQEGSSENWEGNVIIALNGDINWEPSKGHYMRGFIQQDTVCFDDDENHPDYSVLRFTAEEAWGITDFDKELKSLFSDIKVYWRTEEPDDEVYATNDKEGKYFKDRFFVDTYIDGEYHEEYFTHKSDIFKWLHKITGGKINTERKIEIFNDKADEEESDDYIHIFEFEVIE